MDFGKRIRLLEHHADARAQLHHVLLLVVDVLAVEQDLPSTRAPGIVSFMRFRQRRNVDLPQPEGPIMASTWFLAMSMPTFLMACFSP